MWLFFDRVSAEWLFHRSPANYLRNLEIKLLRKATNKEQPSATSATEHIVSDKADERSLALEDYLFRPLYERGRTAK